MRIGKEIIGAVTVQSYTDASLYTEKDLKILEFVSGQIAIAIQRKKAEEEARRRTTELAVLNELAQALTAHLSVEDVLKEAYRQISRLMDTTNFYIALYDPENNVINFALNVTESEVDRQALTVIPADQGISGYIIKNRKSVLLEENITEKLERMGIKILGGVPLSWLGVPLIVGEKILGVMAAQSYTVPRAYDEHDRELLTSIANQTAIAIQNAQLYEQVAKSNKLKEMFISIMSHDIKNPLAIIRGYNELLQDIVEEKAKAYSRKIEESVVKINDMIDTARLYSKMKDESYLREFMDVGLGDIIESSIKSLSDKAAQKNVSVYFDRKNPTIGANKTLENVFLNLLDNAIKYSPPGSNVEIEIEEKEDTAKVTVKDHGKGIPDEFKEKIFDKFERGRVEGIEGSGLGLAIAREIVLRHSGKIWVENNRPQGSVFCVELPISH